MRRVVLAAVTLMLVTGGTAAASGRLPAVAGSYTYQLGEGTSHVEVLAFLGAEGASGAFRFSGTFVDLGGPVTCLTVRGSDAWLAGVLTSGDDVGLDGWMVRVSDHGRRDRAVTFIEDYGVAVPWCEAASTEFDEYLQPLSEGWLVVR